MEKIKIILALIFMISLVNGLQRKRYNSNDLFKKRILDLLLEAQERGIFDDSPVQRKKRPYQQLDFNNYQKRDKLFDIYGPPFFQDE